jgi:hypothetical protein
MDSIPDNPDGSDEVLRGLDAKFVIRIYTIPRSKIALELTRNGDSLANDTRFELTQR